MAESCTSLCNWWSEWLRHFTSLGLIFLMWKETIYLKWKWEELGVSDVFPPMSPFYVPWDLLTNWLWKKERIDLESQLYGLILEKTVIPLTESRYKMRARIWGETILVLIIWFWAAFMKNLGCKLGLHRDVPGNCACWIITDIEEIPETLWMSSAREECRMRREGWMRTEGGKGRKRSSNSIWKFYFWFFYKK